MKAFKGGKEVALTAEQIDELRASMSKSPETAHYELVDTVQSRVQQRLDMFAHSRRYASAASCERYINSSNPKFKAEAARMIYLRDATWTLLDNLLESVQAGDTPMPDSVDDVLALLPALTWEG